jgi:nucleotide-binding universal stress UspA family protein
MRILIAYDGSISADAAIDDLRRAGLPELSEARIICVADSGSHAPEPSDRADNGASWTSKVAVAEALAERAAARMRSYFPQWTVFSEGLWGAPAKIILDTTGWWLPDLLVVGSHGHSPVERLFIGSVSLELIHKAPCSVRVARAVPSVRDHPIQIVVGDDGSARAATVLRAVAQRAWPKNTEAQIVSVVETLAPVATAIDASTYAQEPAYSVIHEADERRRFRLKSSAAESTNILRRSGLIVSSAIVDGDPREAIVAAAEAANADAIFVGARGLGRMERLLMGSVSSYVVNHAHCSVEVVRGDQG